MFNFMCMSVCAQPVCLVPDNNRDGIIYPDIGAMDSCEPTYGYWEPTQIL